MYVGLCMLISAHLFVRLLAPQSVGACAIALPLRSECLPMCDFWVFCASEFGSLLASAFVFMAAGME